MNIEVFKKTIEQWIDNKHPEINLVDIVSVRTFKTKILKEYFASVAAIRAGDEVFQIIHYNDVNFDYDYGLDEQELALHECGHLLEHHYNINFDMRFRPLIREIDSMSPAGLSEQDASELFAEGYRLWYCDKLSLRSKY